MDQWLRRSMLRRAPFALLAVAVALAACVGSSSPAGAPGTGSPSPSRTESPPPPPPPPPIAPLTGLEVESEAIVRRPALAVKIDNATGARPQVGLERADIVYEEPVEGGITRFIAVFHSQGAPRVGPVRSARLTDLDVLAEYGRPLLSFSGAAGYVLRAVARADLVSLEHGRFGSLYRRDGSRPAPHNLFSSTQELWRAARNANATPAPSLFAFGDLPDPPPAATAASPSPGEASPSPPSPSWPSGARVTIPFAGSSWTAIWRWNADAGRYVRAHGTGPHRAATGRRIGAENVIVMRVRTQRRNQAAAARGTPELRLVGSGQAVLLRDGVRIPGRWSRASLDEQTVFTDMRGRPFVLAPGQTWIELVPTRIRPRYA